jgi:kumamolisin
VEFPASSPYVLACGGTSIIASNGKISSEEVWNSGAGGATGGGISTIFSRPDWQSAISILNQTSGRNERGIPDIAADADPGSGYTIYIHGQSTVIGGTVSQFFCEQMIGRGLPVPSSAVPPPASSSTSKTNTAPSA